MIAKKSDLKELGKCGRIAAFTLRELARNVRPGVTTSELNSIAERLIKARGGVPSFKDYHGFPSALCVSINDEVVHGLPGQRKIKLGDLVGLDIGVNLGGYFTDCAITVSVGCPNKKVQTLLLGVKEALVKTIKIARVGCHVGDLEAKCGDVLKSYHLKPILALSGHGTGRAVHEKPAIKSDGRAGDGSKIIEGMVLAIEPMATLGSGQVITSSDGWTVKTANGEPSAHFEHTVVITKTGAKILTLQGPC